MSLPNVNPLPASGENVVQDNDGDDETNQASQEPIVVFPWYNRVVYSSDNFQG